MAKPNKINNTISNNNLNIRQIDKNFSQTPNIGLFVDVVFNNFIDLYEFPQLNHNKQEITRLLTANLFNGYIVYYKNVIIGYLLGEIVEYDGMRIFFINYLFVAELFRNKKIGKQLVAYSKRYSLVHSLDGVGLINDTNNKKNMSFYRKLGFKQHINRTYQQHEFFIWKKHNNNLSNNLSQ